MIVVVDYGLGNVRAFENLYQRCGLSVASSSTAEGLGAASHLILPGVGSFDHAMGLLESSGLRRPLEQLVLQDRVPVLGICVGMQMLAERSDEGSAAGLGWIPGAVELLPVPRRAGDACLPHMGWNEVHPTGSDGLLEGIDPGRRFYFLHSYHFRAAEDSSVLATTEYRGQRFACAVGVDNVMGVQFHPEKSHAAGERLLTNFVRSPLGVG